LRTQFDYGNGFESSRNAYYEAKRLKMGICSFSAELTDVRQSMFFQSALPHSTFRPELHVVSEDGTEPPIESCDLGERFLSYQGFNKKLVGSTLSTFVDFYR